MDILNDLHSLWMEDQSRRMIVHMLEVLYFVQHYKFLRALNDHISGLAILEILLDFLQLLALTVQQLLQTDDFLLQLLEFFILHRSKQFGLSCKFLLQQYLALLHLFQPQLLTFLLLLFELLRDLDVHVLPVLLLGSCPHR